MISPTAPALMVQSRSRCAKNLMKPKKPRHKKIRIKVRCFALDSINEKSNLEIGAGVSLPGFEAGFSGEKVSDAKMDKYVLSYHTIKR